MKIRILLLSLAAIIFIPFNSWSGDYYPGYARHTDETYGFNLLLPLGWEREEVRLPDRHVLIMARRDGAEIRISATPLDEKEKTRWDNWREWSIDGIGRNLNEILDRDNIKIGGDITGRLIVFEYTDRRPTLQRILIARFGKTQVVIECMAPTRTFPTYDSIFNAVMGSLSQKKAEK